MIMPAEFVARRRRLMRLAQDLKPDLVTLNMLLVRFVISCLADVDVSKCMNCAKICRQY